MTTYRLVRTGNTGNSNSYTAGGGITINGDIISTNPTEDLVITGDKIGIKPTYVQDNFYVTGTTLVREVADGTKVNLDFTDLINHIESNSGGDTSYLENQISNLQQQVTMLDARAGFPVTYSFIDSGDYYLFTSDNGYYFSLPKPKYSLSVDNDGQLTLTDEVFGYNTNVRLPQVTKLTDGLGKSMLLPQGEYIISPEYKTGYYYVEGNDLPSNPIKDGNAYYVTKEYYGSMNFKLTATHVGTGRTFVGVNSDMAGLVWKELTTEA